MRNVTGLVVVAAIVCSACGSAEDASPLDSSGNEGGEGGSSHAVGSAGSIAATGGTSSSGGTTSSSGGAPNMAGAQGTGGTVSTGGTQNTGGTRDAGGGGGAMPVDGGGKLPSDAPHLMPGVWTVINPSTSCNPPGAYGVTVNQADPSMIYLASCGIHVSTNAGTTWRHIGAIGSGPTKGQYLGSSNYLRMDPKNPKHLYVSDGVHGGTNGFWVSTDGGETFDIPDGFAAKANNSVGGWTPDVYNMQVDPTDFNHVLVAFHSPFENSGRSGILESKDGGNTWIRHFPIATLTGAGWGIWFLYRPDLGIGNSSTWLLGAQGGGGHWRTTDAGGTWNKVTDNSMEHGGGQIYYTADGTLYSTGTPNVMRSTDNGATWTMVGPSAGYIGIIGDGNEMYVKAHDRTNPIITAAEKQGTSWTDYTPQPPQFFGGAYEYDFDRTNRIVYGAYLTAGLMALKVP
jgi:hypothetical protein